MNPEESLVPPLAVALPNCLPGVLVQELADHGLGDGVDDAGVGGAASRFLTCGSGSVDSSLRRVVEVQVHVLGRDRRALRVQAVPARRERRCRHFPALSFADALRDRGRARLHRAASSARAEALS